MIGILVYFISVTIWEARFGEPHSFGPEVLEIFFGMLCTVLVGITPATFRPLLKGKSPEGDSPSRD